MAESTPATKPKVQSIYSSSQGQQALEQHYNDMIASLDFPVDTITVPTTWGNAYVLAAGPKDGIPLMLWQGTAAPAPCMLSTVTALVPKYRIYAPDYPCQSGSRSDPAILSPEQNEIGKWAAEVVKGLNLSVATKTPILHIGVSFGGGILIDLMRVEPSLISAAVLLVPGSLNPNYDSLKYHIGFFWSVLFPMMAYRMFPCGFTRRRVFASMFDEPDKDNAFMKQMDLSFKYVTWYPKVAKRIESKEEIAECKAPTLVVTAKKDVFGGGEETAQRAREVFTEGTVEVEVLEGKHVWADGENERLMKKVSDFFDKDGFPGKV